MLVSRSDLERILLSLRSDVGNKAIIHVAYIDGALQFTPMKTAYEIDRCGIDWVRLEIPYKGVFDERSFQLGETLKLIQEHVETEVNIPDVRPEKVKSEV